MYDKKQSFGIIINEYEEIDEMIKHEFDKLTFTKSGFCGKTLITESKKFEFERINVENGRSYITSGLVLSNRISDDGKVQLKNSGLINTILFSLDEVGADAGGIPLINCYPILDLTLEEYNDILSTFRSDLILQKICEDDYENKCFLSPYFNLRG